jgi:hypothetical protein
VIHCFSSMGQNRKRNDHTTGFWFCGGCNIEFPLTVEFFWKSKRAASGFQNLCKDCSKHKLKLWQISHRERTRESARDRQQLLRKAALEHYGGIPPKCKCCGELELKFLAIDHIYGGGTKHLKSIGNGHLSGTKLPSWLKINNYPEGFQILCHNCNTAKGCYGKCPHQEKT